MKKIILGFICATSLFSVNAQALQNWIVIGDSIVSSVPQGTASQMALNLVGDERDVIFKSLASPGASLGYADNTGFNNATTLNMIDQLAGYWVAYNGILVQAGTNDFSRSANVSDTYNSLKAIIAKAKASNKKVMVLDPIWRADEAVVNTQGNDLNAYRAAMRSACGEEPATCYFAHRKSTVLGTSAGSALFDESEVAKGNQLHPNFAGHRKLADWIKTEAKAAGFF